MRERGFPPEIFGARIKLLGTPVIDPGPTLSDGRSTMFESLDDQMKHDEMETTTPRERWLKWLLVGVVSVLLFAGLYAGVRLLE
ncbi:MAG: hypothetical protein ACUVS7_11020 [Bryobacteraceae bacterium]